MGGWRKVSGEEEEMGNTSAPPLYCARSCFDHRAEPCGACPLNQGSPAGLLATLFHLLRSRTGEDGWGVSGGGGVQEEIPEEDLSCYLLGMKGRVWVPTSPQEAKNIKKDGNIKNLSCKEKHSSSHEGNEIRGNCETRRFDQTQGGFQVRGPGLALEMKQLVLPSSTQ